MEKEIKIYAVFREEEFVVAYPKRVYAQNFVDGRIEKLKIKKILVSIAS